MNLRRPAKVRFIGNPSEYKDPAVSAPIYSFNDLRNKRAE